MTFWSKLPIVQAPMAGVQGPALAIAVCEAGGLGSLPCAMLTVEQARAQMLAMLEATRAPFNVNFFCHRAPEPNEAAQAAWRELLAPFYAEMGLDAQAEVKAPVRAPFDRHFCELLEEIRPPVVSFHFGLPQDSLLQRVRRTGAKIFGCATTVAEAIWLQARGVDAIIAQGVEAGGHRGLFLDMDIAAQPGLFALLPQVVKAVNVPVIAAGGLVDGQSIAAAFALGASAAQLGTAYLLAEEATTSPAHRAAIQAARADSTRLTTLFSGRPARGLVNRLMRELGCLNPAAPAFPLASAALAPLRAAAEAYGSGDFSPLWAGQGAAFAREGSAGDLTRRFWREAQEAAQGLSERLKV